VDLGVWLATCIQQVVQLCTVKVLAYRSVPPDCS